MKKGPQATLERGEFPSPDREGHAHLGDVHTAHDFLKAVLNGLDAQVCLLDSEGVILEANAAWHEYGRQISGDDFPHGIGTPYHDVFRNDDGGYSPRMQKLVANIRQVISQWQARYVAEYACNTPAGKRWLQLCATQVPDDDRAAAVVVHVDITERVLATLKAQQQASEFEMLALVARHTDNGVVVTDRNAKIEWINEAFTRISGYTLEEVNGRGLERLLNSPETRLETVIAFCQAVKDGRDFDNEMLVRVKDGSSKWLSIEVRPVRDEQGNVTRFIALERDISQRKRQELERERAEKRIRSIFNTAAEGIITIKSNGEIVESNPAAEEMFGAENDGLVGRNVASLMPEPHASGYVDYLTEFRELRNGEGSGIRREVQAKRLNGELFSAELSASGTVVNDEWLFTGFLCDVTEKKSLQEQLVHARKMESIGQLAAGIAHEINTPMQYINGNIEFLKNSYDRLFRVVDVFCESLTDRARPWEERRSNLLDVVKRERYEQIRKHTPGAVDEAFEGIHRVIDIVRAMKAMTHPGTREKTSTDLNELLRNASIVSRNRWKFAADLELKLDKNLPPIECLAGEVSQVLLNLIVNAADAIVEKYGDNPTEKGTIVIRTQATDRFATITVEDSGCGMPNDVRQRVFDPFFTTKDVGKGTGQGLAISYDVVVNKHGGQITVDAAPDEGTTFTVLLPYESETKASASSNSEERAKVDLGATPVN